MRIQNITIVFTYPLLNTPIDQSMGDRTYNLSYFIKSPRHSLTPDTQHCPEGEGGGGGKLDTNFSFIEK